jgi:hypothetical protein
MVATAHGVDLRSVLSNVELKPLLGGVTLVTLGDEVARRTNGGQKTCTERTGAPTFTSAVEVLAVDRCAGRLERDDLVCCQSQLPDCCEHEHVSLSVFLLLRNNPGGKK